MIMSVLFRTDYFEDSEERMLEVLKKMDLKKEEWIEVIDNSSRLEEAWEEGPEKFKEEIENIIKTVINYPYRRDSASITIHEIEIIISGGMSWGDEPTELSNKITLFNRLPREIIEAGGFSYEELPSIYESFIKENKDKMPEKLLEELKAWNIGGKI